MKSLKDIKKLVTKFKVKPTSEMKSRVLDEALQMQRNQNQQTTSDTNTWRLIMKNKTIKLAIAASLIIATLIGINHLGGSIDGASVAWADVTKHIAQIDYAHVYYLKNRDNVLMSDFEAWYDHGKMVMRGKNGGMSYDDGQTLQTFDEHKKRVGKKPSHFAEGQTFLEVFTVGLLSERNEQFNQHIPANVGDDFLIYEFDPPVDGDFLESVFITVGKNSLLPIQMKVYHKDGDYDVIMFDYEAPEKPLEFFESLPVAAPDIQGEIVLDGEEVVFDINGVPGLKQAVVRLHDMYNGPVDQLPSAYHQKVRHRFPKTYEKKGGPVFRLDVYFITDKGYLSATNDVIVLWLNETIKGGVGSEAGGLDNWPDGKYRNIKFSPMLKPTDREDVYTLEMNCWLRPK